MRNRLQTLLAGAVPGMGQRGRVQALLAGAPPPLWQALNGWRICFRGSCGILLAPHGRPNPDAARNRDTYIPPDAPMLS